MELEANDTHTPHPHRARTLKGNARHAATLTNPHFRETAPSRVLRPVGAHQQRAGVCEKRREHRQRRDQRREENEQEERRKEKMKRRRKKLPPPPPALPPRVPGRQAEGRGPP